MGTVSGLHYYRLWHQIVSRGRSKPFCCDSYIYSLSQFYDPQVCRVNIDFTSGLTLIRIIFPHKIVGFQSGTLTMEHIVVLDHGPTKVRVGGRRGRAQDGGRGGADVAALQERDGGAPAGDHTQACTVTQDRN